MSHVSNHSFLLIRIIGVLSTCLIVMFAYISNQNCNSSIIIKIYIFKNRDKILHIHHQNIYIYIYIYYIYIYIYIYTQHYSNAIQSTAKQLYFAVIFYEYAYSLSQTPGLSTSSRKLWLNCVCVCMYVHHPRGSEAIGSTLSWAARARQKGGGLWWEHGGGGVPKKRKWHTLPPTLPYNRLGTPMSSHHRPYTTGLCVSGEQRHVIRSRICSVFTLTDH